MDGTLPTNTRRQFVFQAVPVFLIFAFLWFRGFPQPHFDDLFYCGAAFNMASGGDFSNPYLVRFFPNDHYFFAYPPVHSYALAAWVKVFGVNAAAATAFQAVMYIVMALSVMAMLRRHGATGPLLCVVPLAAIHAFLGDGLRTEPMAVAFSWAGFAVLDSGIKKTSVIFFGLLIMFLAGATAPRNAVYNSALIIVAILGLWKQCAGSSEKRMLLYAGIAAAAVSVFAFLWMIHFKLGAFCNQFLTHAKTIKHHFSEPYGLKDLLLMGAAGVLAIVLWKFRSDRLVQVYIPMAVATGIAMFTRTMGYGPSEWHKMLMIVFLCAVCVKRMPVAAAVLAQTGLIALFAWLALPELLPVYGELAGHISTKVAGPVEEARNLTSAADRQLFVDPWAARYAYDYKTPKGAVDFLFALPFPSVVRVIPGLMQPGGHNPNDTYVLGTRFLDYVQKSTYLNPEPIPKWTCLGRSYYQYPRQIAIIHAADCKGVKSDKENP